MGVLLVDGKKKAMRFTPRKAIQVSEVVSRKIKQILKAPSVSPTVNRSRRTRVFNARGITALG